MTPEELTAADRIERERWARGLWIKTPAELEAQSEAIDSLISAADEQTGAS